MQLHSDKNHVLTAAENSTIVFDFVTSQSPIVSSIIEKYQPTELWDRLSFIIQLTFRLLKTHSYPSRHKPLYDSPAALKLIILCICDEI